jgi:hypothetical protein
VFPAEFFDEMGLVPIPVKDIRLRPSLIDEKEEGR